MVSGSKSGGAPWERKSAISPTPVSGKEQATPGDRKRQLAQLAEMGVAVPEDFRREMAMAGDWQTTSERLVYENDFMKKEGDEDVKPGGLNVGIRKRKFEGQEEQEEAGETVIRRGWGSTIRTYPGAEGDEDDLNTLLKSTKRLTREGEGLQSLGIGQLFQPEQADSLDTTKESMPALDAPAIKEEESAGFGGILDTILDPRTIEAPLVSLKQEDPPNSGVIFKKRKAKPIRQK